MMTNDLNFRVLIISALLTVLLAISNTYLALKVGLLTAASIPAAILSMGIMKFFKESSVFEHNLIQTAASSGEAVAGGIVYTIPGLIVIGFWQNFPYLINVFIALLSGVLGVFFSAIIRRALVSDQSLRFPEAHAITEVLRLKQERVLGFKELLTGGLIAAIIEFIQSTGAALVGVTKFFVQGGVLLGFGVSFAPALVGAGFIIGARVGLSLFFGAVLSYLVLLPIISHGQFLFGEGATQIFSEHFSENIRYIGIGAMLVAAVLTLMSLLKPLFVQISKTVQRALDLRVLSEHDRDLSKRVVIIGILLCAFLLYPLLMNLYQLTFVDLSLGALIGLLLGSILYILIVGFIAAVVCGYFSGLVGVSASPGSSIIIAGMIFAALLTHAFLAANFASVTQDILLHGEAITIIVGGIVTGIACIANDTIQDLKVGQMLKASPRKQQIMLLFGVFIASLVIPLVMEVLYQAYGFVGNMPRPGMNVNNALAIPPAAMMAALTQGVFSGNVPWHEMSIGAFTMLVLFLFNFVFKKFNFGLSLLGVGIGMYLPLSSSTALIIGSLLALFVQLRLRHASLERKNILSQKKLLLACGFVTGATLMDVGLAVPVALNPSGAALSFTVSPLAALCLGVITALMLVVMTLKVRE
jgi:putative OPT family oligopeptide transporter